MATLASVAINDLSMMNLLFREFTDRMTMVAINTVNVQAGLLRKEAMKNLRNNLRLRNNFLEKSIVYKQMPMGRFPLNEIKAEFIVREKGREILERQEFGGIRRAFEGKHLSIATDVARGGDRNAVVQKDFYLSNLSKNMVRGRSGRPRKNSVGTKKSMQVARAYVAFREHKMMRYGGNIHFVDNFVARGGQVSFQLRQVYGFNKTETVTPARPWFAPARDYVLSQRDGIFASQMKKAGF